MVASSLAVVYLSGVLGLPALIGPSSAGRGGLHLAVAALFTPCGAGCRFVDRRSNRFSAGRSRRLRPSPGWSLSPLLLRERAVLCGLALAVRHHARGSPTWLAFSAYMATGVDLTRMWSFLFGLVMIGALAGEVRRLCVGSGDGGAPALIPAA